jgi:ATP-binding cassette subfamily C protein
MINKRLIGIVKESKKYIAGNIFFQWISLIANIFLMWSIAHLLQSLYDGSINGKSIISIAIFAFLAITVRFLCSTLSTRMSYLSSKSVKKTLREMIYRKLLRLGTSYKEKVNTAEVVQVAVEGVEQLETYFGAYLPQFFYAMLAPLSLFVVLSFISFRAALVLLICVPLIPISIMAVQRWAKKLLGKYWGQYTALGDVFLENLQGLTTTKIYQSDEFKHQEMNKQGEIFRKITMRVLTMQLNSIFIMDLVAYGGAAIGVILATTQFRAGNVSLAGSLMIILLAADFFLPMRMLGSYFHIAMNGMAASEKIFNLLDLPEIEVKTLTVPSDCTIKLHKLNFSYEPDRKILDDVTMIFPMGSFTAIVGESGSGKSTIASILMGRAKAYDGQLTVGAVPLSDISEDNLMKNFTYINHQSYLFKGTVRDNLLIAAPDASDEKLWQVLAQVNLEDFLRNEGGLDLSLSEKASNLSGGQRQRLALARALLHDSSVYIFDEASSNIDVESESDIMRQIQALAKRKTVILISHRLANVVNAKNIYLLDKGSVLEHGTHKDLISQNGAYAQLWKAQQELENYAAGVTP